MHFENLLFILLVAVALLFQLLTRAASKMSKKSRETDQPSTSPAPTARPAPRAAVQTDEERIRKFLEALGQPTTARPPPPVVPRTDIPPRPLAPVQPPSGSFSPPPRRVTRQETRKRAVILHESPEGTPGEWLREKSVPASAETGARPKKVRSRETSALPIAAAARSTPANIEIATLLSSSTGLRDAIVLREIFGPPRSLQPLDLVGSA
jgi:hypothetical protein